MERTVIEHARELALDSARRLLSRPRGPDGGQRRTPAGNSEPRVSHRSRRDRHAAVRDSWRSDLEAIAVALDHDSSAANTMAANTTTADIPSADT
jgi:hypothetical protein